MANEQVGIKIKQTAQDPTDLYFDGVLRAHLIGGNIKIDMLTIDPDDTGNATGRVEKRVVMGLQAFLAAKDVMDNMIQQLVEKGIISKQ